VRYPAYALLALVLLAAVVVCIGPPRADLFQGMERAEHPTLLVLNDTGSHLAVMLNGRRIGTVVGTRQCILLRDASLSGMDRLSFRVTARRAEPGPSELLRSHAGWSVRLSFDNRLERDAMSLQPAARCD
jgi:hypothetical protein